MKARACFLYFPAGDPLVPSDAATDQPEEAHSGVLALMLGGEPQEQATPEGGAEPEATPPEDSAVDPDSPEATPED